jgi:acetyl esterase/lipase
MYIHDNADSLGIDPSQLFLTGFSAGGNLALASLHLINNGQLSKDDYPHLSLSPTSTALPKIRGAILFYPLLDFTKTRNEKRSECERPDLALPPALTNLFDESYLRNLTSQLDLSQPLLSPGAASDIYIKGLPPIYLVLCQHDMLRAEGAELASRLRRLGKDVEERTVENERHGWDKVPFSSKSNVGVEYDAAWEVLERWLDLPREL